MNRVLQLWQNYLDSAYPHGATANEMRKVHFITSFSIVGIINFSVFGILYLFSGQYWDGVAELAFGAFAVINLIVLRYHRRSETAARVIILILFAALLFLLHTGGVHQTGILWIYTFPAIVFFLQGRRRGFVWCLLLAVVLGLGIGLEAYHIPATVYDELTLRQALISLAAVTLLLYFYEDFNERSQGYIKQTNDRLSLLNRQLKQEVRDRQQAQVKYGEGLHQIEQKNEQLEGTKRAMLNMLEDLNAEKQLAEAAKLRDEALLNSIGEGLIFIDARGTIANINPSALQMLGYDYKDLIGRWFPNVVVARHEDGSIIEAMERPAVRAISTGQVISEVAEYQRKNKSYIPVSITISPVVVNGKPIGAIEVFRDITKERELERAKEEFVSLASHQLRTPATGVKAYVSMLLDGYAGKLTAKQQEFMQKVFDSNERQLEIVGDMLNVARVDAGRLVPEMADTDMTSLLEDVIAEQKQTILERGQKLGINIMKKPAVMHVDPKLVRMAVENLLSNASKYTPDKGALAISASIAGNQLKIEVTDHGVGIAKADQARLFRRFQRIDNKLSTARGGTGLGLYLTANIIALHKGRLEVKSKLDAGSTFTMTLPIVVKKQTNSLKLKSAVQ